MALNRERRQEDSSRTLPIQIDLTEIKLIIDKKCQEFKTMHQDIRKTCFGAARVTQHFSSLSHSFWNIGVRMNRTKAAVIAVINSFPLAGVCVCLWSSAGYQAGRGPHSIVMKKLNYGPRTWQKPKQIKHGAEISNLPTSGDRTTVPPFRFRLCSFNSIYENSKLWIQVLATMHTNDHL